MLKTSFSLSLVLIATILIGCEQQPNQTANPVVVIDISRIVTEMGWNELTRAQLQPIQEQFTKNLELKYTLIEKELKDAADALGEQPTDAQKIEYQKLQNSKMRAFEQDKAQAMKAFEQARSQLDKQLREKLIPYARKAALNHGAKIVLTKNQQVIITSDPSLDITDEVIKAMSKIPQANENILSSGEKTDKISPDNSSK